ncbi:hypothetical protein NG895_27245 [Aeoliella sp. ICT_H6.2]|uniref:Leucyl aminopeptidase (Aminopeptidase T) n=1 Tax=Aeoliella straminimaris TaxID=2954799 RepID=A0A9X2FG18_9BACT|nr:hypothetical protein [Aeoliella straminimaris]MCO6047618.1 hypothetical protein [Aeoliella straminimaris]
MPFDQAIESLLDVNLGCRKGERLAIVTDDAPFNTATDEVPTRQALAELIAEKAQEREVDTLISIYPGGQESGAEPPRHVFEQVYPAGFMAYLEETGLTEKLLDKSITAAEIGKLEKYLGSASDSIDVMLVLSASSVSHTNFRRLLTRTKTARVATMPGVELEMFAGVMTADWKMVEHRSEVAAEALTKATEAEVHSADGRVLRFSLEGRDATADTGIINQPGQFGNLPGGEGFIAPIEGTAEGELSVGPPEEPGKWHFRFTKGELVEVLGDPPFMKRLDDVFAAHPIARNLAELGVGTNEKAKPCDSVLESEKILGTVHLAVGDNAGFGGEVSVPFHQDFIVYQPTLVLRSEVGEESLVSDGRFMAD